MGMQKKGYLEEKLYVGNSGLNWALWGVCQSSWLQAIEFNMVLTKAGRESRQDTKENWTETEEPAQECGLEPKQQEDS